MSTNETLIADIEAFLERFAMPPTQFGLRAIGDAKLVSELKEGRDLRTSTVERIRNFMRDYRPPNPKRAGEYQPAV